MQYLSIDLGEKRTGIAVGDDDTQFISPVAVLMLPRATQETQLIARLLELVSEHGVQAVVIGLPLNMDGSEGPPALQARAFGEALTAAGLTCPIHYQDERLTSFAAEQHLNQSGRTHKEKKHLRDALAAAEILRDYFSTTRERET